MDDFETLLDKAQLGDREAMDKLLETYMPMIDGIVFSFNKKLDKKELKMRLVYKFEENVKKFKKNVTNWLYVFAVN